MTIPTIEEILAPHLARFRREAEARSSVTIVRVSISFRDGDSPYGLAAPCAAFVEGWHTSVAGYGATIDEAIKKAIEELPAAPDLASILGYNEVR